MKSCRLLLASPFVSCPCPGPDPGGSGSLLSAERLRSGDRMYPSRAWPLPPDTLCRLDCAFCGPDANHESWSGTICAMEMPAGQAQASCAALFVECRADNTSSKEHLQHEFAISMQGPCEGLTMLNNMPFALLSISHTMGVVQGISMHNE